MKNKIKYNNNNNNNIYNKNKVMIHKIKSIFRLGFFFGKHFLKKLHKTYTDEHKPFLKFQCH